MKALNWWWEPAQSTVFLKATQTKQFKHLKENKINVTRSQIDVSWNDCKNMPLFKMSQSMVILLKLKMGFEKALSKQVTLIFIFRVTLPFWLPRLLKDLKERVGKEKVSARWIDNMTIWWNYYPMMRQNDDKCLFDEAAFERFNGFGWFRPQFVHVMAPITLWNYYDEVVDDEDDDENIEHEQSFRSPFSVFYVYIKNENARKSSFSPLFCLEQSFVAIVYYVYFGKHWNKVWNLQLKMSGWRKVYSSDLFCIEYRNTCIASLLQRTRQKAFLQFFTKSTKNNFKKLFKYVLVKFSVLFHIF